MGNPLYDFSSRSMRAVSSGYHSKSVNEIFTQSKVGRAHASMSPKDLKLREACDSENHPHTVPIVIGLDVTGSMGHIPHELIKDGLPNMMAGMIQRGVKDAAVCFIAIGDHEVDNDPLQVGQFESGDAELDMWLTRTYLEGGGGGNYGESYALAWLFGARYTRTDAWDKRSEKGFLITIGDEPFLKKLPESANKEIFGETAQGNVSSEEVLAEAQKRWNVYHLFLEHGARRCDAAWKQALGDNCVIVKDYKDVSNIIANIVVHNSSVHNSVEPTDSTQPTNTHTAGDDEIIL